MSHQISYFALFAFVACFESWDVGHTPLDMNWMNDMQEELGKFERNQVCVLVPSARDCHPMRTKWVFKNKQGKDGMVVCNKARLVAQGFFEIEGTNYEETFAHVAHKESIRNLIVFATSKGFKLFKWTLIVFS